ncbi:MAG: pyruvate formate lyase-activating protein [Lachnospiraceae bacterium]|nr:pyruvate formate lyase-activating protein [Lachnospiraceae bacterium]
MTGRIHSIESFGTVDGPGVRLVVFLQGCPMRCMYCHNPDTWNMDGGTEMSVDDILKRYEENQAFYTKGGITVTGGDPLVQITFVTELFEAAKARSIHTCLDTSGITFRPDSQESISRFDRLINVTDLVMLDIKHIDRNAHKHLTGQSLEPILAFARYLDQKSVPVWIRHVVVPGITYKQELLYRLGRFVGTLNNVQALDVLPYHDMGKIKYKKLGIPYLLEKVNPLDKEDAQAARHIILQGILDERKIAQFSKNSSPTLMIENNNVQNQN